MGVFLLRSNYSRVKNQAFRGIKLRNCGQVKFYALTIIAVHQHAVDKRNIEKKNV